MGSVVISVDAELGWGFHDLGPEYDHRVEAARLGWATLLDLFDAYEIPATWAVVGHLMLDDCDGTHADHPTPPGWFERERNGWTGRRDLRFGGELIDRLVASPVDHDIGCHTFSHVVLTDPRVTREMVRAELQAAADAAKPYGLELESFVFPRNQVAYRDVLAEFGYTAYRGAGTEAYDRHRQPVAKFADALFGDPDLLVHPTLDQHGLVDVPPSLFLYELQGLPRDLITAVRGEDPVVRLAKRGIDRAAEADGVFHLWLHPNNLVDPSDVGRLREILAYLREQVDTTSLSVETMADVADRVQAERWVAPTV
ncbi:polysaccharide deacetylase family protein [Halorarius litoreus]|uniref:polysaccharide deacetylase family protein n=1 Tax=Halorarius litoreus TaxID=2962676 RepID=UPI0020CE3D14|nr:polysaccharide deacetylase family protein [Halorarius litoreus]